ncbi:MAG: glutamyl-tRNA reductase [Bacteroidota bacterium]
MDLFIIGINHRTAPLEVREKMWLSIDEKRHMLRHCIKHFFSECFVVSTCNRTELYGIVDEKQFPQQSHSSHYQEIQDFFVAYKNFESQLRPENLYKLTSVNAIKHLFRVAAGVDSMVVGDVQILGQIKDDFQLAIDEHTAGTMMHKLLQSALHLGKRVRTETTIMEGAVSVSYAAVELANKIFADFDHRKALLIGAGETGELTAKHLAGRGIGELFITNRTRQKAEELASTIGGSVVEFENFHSMIATVDIIISSVTATEYILTAAQIKNSLKQRRHSPLFIFDIGVPRNIDPGANDIDNVFLNDMDSLSNIVAQNIHKRQLELPKVNELILEELKNIHQWYRSLQVGPTIVDLRNHFENVRREVVSEHINRFSEKEKELVELVTKRIVNKLLHHPTVTLRNGHDETESQKKSRLDLVRSLFGLSGRVHNEEKSETH